MIHLCCQISARGWFSVDVPGKGSQPVTFSLCQAWTTYSSRSKRLLLMVYYMPPVGIVKHKKTGKEFPSQSGRSTDLSTCIHRGGNPILEAFQVAPEGAVEGHCPDRG